MATARDRAPLAGVIMCCTSITPEERQVVATASEEMGAVHKFDLTSDVTHLVVGKIDTPKYKYVAKERPDVKVVLPSFVSAVREAWIEGGDPNVAEFEEQHKVPALYDLRICLTGFEAASAREGIRHTVVGNGGEFHGDLTRAVTHLVAAAPTGKKYEHALRWNIRIVSYEWLSDSVERGMVLDELLYDPVKPVAERGLGAWNRHALETNTLGKRQREEENAPGPPPKRKIRRTMSKKMETHQESIWADLASAGSGQQQQQETWEDQQAARPSEVSDDEQKRRSAPRDAESGVRHQSNPADLARELHSERLRNTIFQGRLFILHGFIPQRLTKLKDIMESNGALCLSSTNPEIDASFSSIAGYIIVQQARPRDRDAAVPHVVAQWLQLTEWWVERCLSSKTFVDPDLHPLGRPLTSDIVQGFEQLSICVTGFQDYAKLHIVYALEFMGAKYSDYLTADINIMICGGDSIDKEKAAFTQKNSIPAVKEEWLYASIQSGKKQETQPYLVHVETPTLPISHPAPKVTATKRVGNPHTRTLQLDQTSSRGGARATDVRKRTLDCQPSAPKPAKRAPGPFVDNDSESEQELPHNKKMDETSNYPFSQPLRELSQEQQNSQSRRRQSSAENPTSLPRKGEPIAVDADENFAENADADVDAGVDADADAATAEAADQQREHDRLNNAIATLRAQKSAAEARRSVSDPKTRVDSLGRKKRGPLGRAPSGGSFGSSLSRAASLASNVSQEDRSSEVPTALPDPSQRIVYGDEQGDEERRALIRRMGGQVDLEHNQLRVESVGKVKDTVKASSGVGAGAAGRTRRKAAAFR